MTRQEDCNHAKLQFNSGDYYLACQGCGARWAMLAPPDWKATMGEFIAPEAANKGVGASLSGHFRVAET